MQETSRSLRPSRPKRLIIATAAVLAAACTPEYDSEPPPETTSTQPIPSTVPCAKVAATTPYSVEATNLLNDLVGETGRRDYKAAWDGVQQEAEKNLAEKEVPEGAIIRVSVAVGNMAAYAEKSKAAGIEVNGVGVGGPQSEGELTDSPTYRFMRAEEDPQPNPQAIPDTVTITFQPKIERTGC